MKYWMRATLKPARSAASRGAAQRVDAAPQHGVVEEKDTPTMTTAAVIRMAGCRLAVPRAERYAHQRRAGKPGQGRRHIANDLVADGEEQKALEHAQRAQRDDQGRELEAGNEESVDQAQAQADHGRNDERRPDRRVGRIGFHQLHRGIEGKDGDGRERHVDAARHDHDQHAHGEDARDDAAAQEIKDVADREEGRVDESDDQAEDDDGQGHQGFVAAQEAVHGVYSSISLAVSLFSSVS